MTHPDRAIEAGAQQLVTLEFGRHARLENLTVPMQARYRDDIKSILTALAAEGLVVVPASDLRVAIDIARRNEDSIDVECLAEYLKDAAAQEQNDLAAAQNGGG